MTSELACFGGPGRMLQCPSPIRRSFAIHAVKVARNRPDGTTLEQVANDFGIHPMTLSKWMRRAAIEDGDQPGVTTAESAENRALKKRVRLLEQENEVLRRAAAIWAGEPPKRLMYPLVRELAVDRLPVAASTGTGSCPPAATTDGSKNSSREVNCRVDLATRSTPLTPTTTVRVSSRRRRSPPRRSPDVSDRVVWRIYRENRWWSCLGNPSVTTDRRPARHRTTTWSAGTSPWMPRTPCGWRTSRNIARVKESSTCARSRTCSRTGSSAGPSTNA